MEQVAFDLPAHLPTTSEAFAKFPSTRYQGSKRKLLPFLHEACKSYSFSSVLDLYSGTASVSLMFRHMGKTVYANDYMRYNSETARLLLSLTNDWLRALDLNDLIERAFKSNGQSGRLVSENYSGIYFPDDENAQIDEFCANLNGFSDREASLLTYLMGQAMLMKRPYNLFHRANLEMRMKDVPRSFGNAKTWATPFQDHMRKLGKMLQKCDFSGPTGTALCLNTSDLSSLSVEPDLIYLDPPYLNGKGVPVDYAGFYHFLEGLVDYALFDQGNVRYPHKPIALKPSRWRTADGGLEEIRDILLRWPSARVAISYRGDGKPSIDSLKTLLHSQGYVINEHTAVEYKYALSKNFDATEDLLIGTPKAII